MKIKRLSIASAAAVALMFSVGSFAGWFSFFNKDDSEEQNVELTTIAWEDLIPDDFVQPENPFSTMSQEEIDKLLDGSESSTARLEKLQAEFDYAPVVDNMDGKRVKLAAYITPLEFDGQTKLSEFLLVPYVGACMHTPAPPANQVVHANSPESVEVNSIYDPVWAVGTIRTETVKSSLAESGYRIEIEKVLPYSQ